MPWKESHRMEERMRFVIRLLDGERMTDLCDEFGISRKTGYKFLERYQQVGAGGMADRPPVAKRLPHQTDREIEKLVLRLREHRPTWGAKKLKSRLEELHPGLKIPAASTIGEILSRSGYIELRKRRRELNYVPSSTLRISQQPNDLWCIDFKGQFRLGNGRYCYPLTITDHYSRYVLGCEALEDTRGEGALSVFEEVFARYGLPKAIRSDNGAPFATRGLGGLSRLSAWFIQLGIHPERIEPGHPEQNGRHERMHLTLKQECTRPPATNMLQQQEKFDQFMEIFNNERPHEALGMKSPAEFYRPSDRKCSADLEELNYPTHDLVRMVMKTGYIRINQTYRCFLTRALTGKKVGLREINPCHWQVSFAHLDLGFIDLNEKHIYLNPENSRALREDQKV